MKVSKPQLFASQPVQKINLPGPKKKVGDVDKQPTGQMDQVGLSEKARLMSQVKNTLAAGDDIRVDKVEHYRALIERGDFSVKPDEVAEKMLDEFL